MTQADIKYAIAVSQFFRNTPIRAREVLDHYSTPAEAWDALPSLVSSDQAGELNRAMDRAIAELDFIARHANMRAYYYKENDYPFRLRECADAPAVLFGMGSPQLNDGYFLSVVGTRRCTERGRQWTDDTIRDLAQKIPNLTIVSGLAYGIDVAAHRAAIAAGLPTIIVPAHGLDRIYPPIHRPVAVEALRNGGILTEYPSMTDPDPRFFLARNRIVAGLSDATLVVESADHGGSLVTARLALDYGREVLAVPGRPSDAISAGCNALIRDQRAALVTSADDIISCMQWQTVSTPNLPIQTDLFTDTDLDETQLRIVHLLRQQQDGMHINQLVTQLTLDYAAVSSSLSLMELDGIVKALPGGIYRTIK